MPMRYVFLASLALGIAAVVTPVAQAASFGSAGARPGTDNLMIVVKEEHKSVHRGHHGGHGCGAFMYRKGGQCVDARDKK